MALLAILSFAATTELVSARQEKAQRELVVCADRDNLPFSNERAQGFENKLASLVAGQLHASLRYAWNPQPRGFRPRLLKENHCDVVMGVPAGLPGVSVTQPYYASSYVFVTERKRDLFFGSFDDPRLHTLKIGLEAIGAEGTNTPPARALARRGITANIVGYSMWSHSSEPDSRAHMVEAVAKGKIDVALMWGPFAGYFGKGHHKHVVLTPVLADPQQPSLPFTYAISVGVRYGNDALLAELQDVLNRRRPDIEAILKEFGIPLVDASERSSLPTAAYRVDQLLMK